MANQNTAFLLSDERILSLKGILIVVTEIETIASVGTDSPTFMSWILIKIEVENL